VRLVLAAKKISYQDVQVNLEKRAKWHYLLNGGFVPMLETPDSGDSKPYMIFESKIIMDFLDRRFPEKLLYSQDPFLRAEQDLMIAAFTDIERNLFLALMSRGKDKQAMLTLIKAFDKLEGWLVNSKTGFFGFAIPTGAVSAYPQKKHAKADYSMVDLYGFPHVSRIFYTQGTPLEQKIFKKLMRPAVQRWVTRMLALPEFQDGRTLTPAKGFKLWVDELMTMPVG